MRVDKRFVLPVLVSLASIMLHGCPANGGSATFPYYVLNLTPSPLVQLKFPDGDTLEFVNVLDSPVPAFKMRVLHLSSAKFGNSLSELQWKLQDGTAGAISARITVGPGELGFIAREFNNGIVGTVYEVELDSKGQLLETAAP